MEFPIYFNSIITLDSVEAGKKILLTQDDYINNLSRYDLSSKPKRKKPISKNALMAYQSKQVMSWSGQEKLVLRKAIQKLKPRLENYELFFPEVIYLVKTTGEEEGGASYCRGANGIFLASTMVRTASTKKKKSEVKSVNELAELICNELWHISSRNAPKENIDKIYSAIGFQRLPKPFQLPEAINKIKISNPDAIFIEHYISVEVDSITNIQNEQEIVEVKEEEEEKNTYVLDMIPILYSSIPLFTGKKDDSCYNYLQLSFLVIEKTKEEEWKPVVMNNELLFVGIGDLPSSFWEQVGRNTDYIFHPDEIIADNFTHIIFRKKRQSKIKSPELLDGLQEVLSKNENENEKENEKENEEEKEKGKEEEKEKEEEEEEEK
ncbi:microtubule-associated protein [Anaeramoeba flamelloides]|uniref:Microtubule-associated protein n=1 Tax=Anaeramoeba flamelloides TaxID=1746091 RepID=A0AAV7Y6E1_9EUKA|nr:microtubule-associated protein [Anaeramoeba flamelloides]